MVHREHACVETAGVRTAKAMGLRALPSKTWQVNCGWVIAANIAADLAAWTRLLGCHDDEELRDADPDTLRYRIWHIPARLAHHARQRTLKISPGWPWIILSRFSGVHHVGDGPLSRVVDTVIWGGCPRRTRGGVTCVTCASPLVAAAFCSAPRTRLLRVDMSMTQNRRSQPDQAECLR